MLAQALADARTIDDASDRAHALAVLAALAPHLLESLLTDALADARTIDDAYARVSALATLTPHLPPSMLAEALAVARTLDDAYARADALAALAPHLPQPQQDEVLAQALADARTLDSASDRASALAALAPHLPRWATRMPASAQPICAETLHALSRHPRPEFLRDLAALTPSLLALAGEEAPQAAAGIYHTIQQVCTWWP